MCSSIWTSQKVEIWLLLSLDCQEKSRPIGAVWGCVDLEEPVHAGQSSQLVDNSL